MKVEIILNTTECEPDIIVKNNRTRQENHREWLIDTLKTHFQSTTRSL